MKNPNCDLGECTSSNTEVRLLPLGRDPYHGNIILCRSCFEHEMQYRRDQAHDTGCPENWDTDVTWESLKIYEVN